MITDLEWIRIQEFPNYDISRYGEIYNRRRDKMMKVSINNYGHVKITLTIDNGERYDRSVSKLVAEAFVSPPNVLCDQVVVLDGDLTNVAAENLVWRPMGFSWKYVRQLKTPQPLYYKNLHVLNIMTGVLYENIVSAGKAEGLLFKDIWYSTYTGKPVFPNHSVFEIVDFL